jgi:transposase
VLQGQVANTSPEIRELLQQWTQTLEAPLPAFVHCAENTGCYTHPLLQLVEPLGLRFWLEDPLQLKQSMGRQRRKTDAVDAHNIAEYCRCKYPQAKWYVPPSLLRGQLRQLSHKRTKLVRLRQSLSTSAQTRAEFPLHAPNEVCQTIDQEMIDVINQQLHTLDAEIKRLIQSDPCAKRKMEIARSVPGIGPKNVLVILAITGLFERIPSARACAAYAGLVPYDFQSGTSVRRRSRVSRAVSKELKTALHQGAQFLIIRPSPFKELYDRLRAKGRSYKQAINAVRHKMVRVLYACLEKDVIYDKKTHAGLA